MKYLLYAGIFGFTFWMISEVMEIVNGYNPTVYYLTSVYHFLAGFGIWGLHNAQAEISLFDGKTFEGWEGNTDYFRVEDGSIVGGSLEKGLEESFYLCTTEEYSDFELSVNVKLVHKNLTGNSGISFRANKRAG